MPNETHTADRSAMPLPSNLFDVKNTDFVIGNSHAYLPSPSPTLIASSVAVFTPISANSTSLTHEEALTERDRIIASLISDVETLKITVTSLQQQITISTRPITSYADISMSPPSEPNTKRVKGPSPTPQPKKLSRSLENLVPFNFAAA